MSTLIALAVLASTEPCTDLDNCFLSARAAVEEAMTIEYDTFVDRNDILATVVRCQRGFSDCSNGGAPYDFGNRVGWTALPGVEGQGLIASVTGRQEVAGYQALRFGDQIRFGSAGPTQGYTVQVTFFWRHGSNPSSLFTIYDDSNYGLYNVGFSRSWYRGPDRLRIFRRATVGPTTRVLHSDRPWDFDERVLQNGPEEIAAPPDPKGLYELYFTFRPDGKVEVDLFSISDRTRDFLVSHLQDTGHPIASYPVQPETGPWQAPGYRNASTLKVESNSADAAILQMVIFNKPLTRSERIGFHSKNLFYRMTGKTGVAYLSHDQVPCNSGEFLNLPPKQSSRTVCGLRPGIRGPDVDAVSDHRPAAED